MQSLSEYVNLDSLLLSNHQVREDFSREWGWNANYLSYLDNLLGFRTENTARIGRVSHVPCTLEPDFLSWCENIYDKFCINPFSIVIFFLRSASFSATFAFPDL